jgi:ribose transport system ATP-binding protein
MDMVGLDLSPNRIMKHLSAAQKQLAQIAKALAANARVLLLDEPTSSLTDHEAQNLFTLLRDLRDKGVIIVFVSHKFEEVFALCDKASVLRDGQHIATRPISELTQDELVDLMIGRPHALERLGSLDVNPKDVVLRVEGLTRCDKIEDVNFTLCKGEILGFYGLVGAGRTETARILMGEDYPDSGRIIIHGKEVKIRHISDALNKYRMGYVTENRKEEGLLLDSPVETNITITVWRRLVHWLTRGINRKQEMAVASNMIEAMSIRTTGLAQKTSDLSGGNQQKISISKWLAADCEILIIDEPTVGVDVGAKAQLHQLIWNLADKSGKSIILISSDMPEIITLASRILVFRERKIVGEICGIDYKTYEEASAAIGQYLA